MSRDWNGLALQSDFANELGDTSAAFKTRVSLWINDVQNEICSFHDWDFLKKKGKKRLSNVESQSLYIDAPATAPTLVLGGAGGSLTDTTSYSVCITFIESDSGLESNPGPSAAITTAAPALQINLSAIPVSLDTLVTGRNIYLKNATGSFYLAATISDNTSTTLTISANTTRIVQPPDYSMISKVSGYLFLEGTSWQLKHYPMDQLRMIFMGKWVTSQPQYWSSLGGDRVAVYPIPTDGTILSFYYFKMPNYIYPEELSIPEIPVWLKPALRAGVIARGYDYRERDGAERKRNDYLSLVQALITNMGEGKHSRMRVRDVNGDTDGFER